MRAIWAVTFFLAGCGLHIRPGLPIGAAPPDPLLVEARQFVEAVAKNMPLWDADEGFARFEQEEIRTVKEDIVKARTGTLSDAAKLHLDWDKLLALDEMLHREYLL
jgi:hypothetical protein